MAFHSILLERPDDRTKTDAVDMPDFFADLNLDQIVSAVTARRLGYNLETFFYLPLKDTDAVTYRQEIFQDLENGTVLQDIKSFAKRMTEMRHHLALVHKLYYKYHKEGWFLEAVEIYCDAVTRLVQDLGAADLKSAGLSAFREYATNYANSEGFARLAAEMKRLKADLSTVRYCVLIKNSTVKVRQYDSEIDYSVEVEKTFEKFKHGAAKDYLTKMPMRSGMDHVEAQILDFVAKLHPHVFIHLDNFYTQNSRYVDKTIAAFDREVQFYIAYLEHIAKLKKAGLAFCYPQISSMDKEIYDRQGFDLALAHKLIAEGSTVVCNDFYLKGRERIIVVSGPNQGGKTTFARTFGQLHYLAALGCPVPGRHALLFLFDRIFTHFEREEDIENLHGKLQDDLVRVHDIISGATSKSIIIINEIFTSTTLRDAVYLGSEILRKIDQLDLLCVCVTFIDELASLSDKTVSMVGTVVPENPAVRTYKIVRRPADGLSYAISIAEKYRLTYHCLMERIPS